jgi:SAM-dependent methyltransferase
VEEGNCTFCGKNGKSEVYIQARLDGDSFTYCRCSDCGLIFLNPRPDAKEILKFYSGEYYGEGTRKFRKWLEAPRKYFAHKRIQRVEKYFAQSGRALDVGCGQGTFLQMMQEKGWECHGIELTADISSRAAQLGISVSVGEVQEGQFPDGSLDLITLWHVLEHLEDPSKALRTFRPMLKPKGILAISTPNIDSLQARISGSRWFHLDPPRHLYLFSPKTLLPLMESLGFSLLKIRFFSMEQNPYGWLQSLLNLMGFPENSLYLILKNTPLSRKQRLSFWARGMTLLVASGLFPACLLLSLSLDHFGWGGTMEAYFTTRD